MNVKFLERIIEKGIKVEVNGEVICRPKKIKEIGGKEYIVINDNDALAAPHVYLVNGESLELVYSTSIELMKIIHDKRELECTRRANFIRLLKTSLFENTYSLNKELRGYIKLLLITTFDWQNMKK